MSEQPADDTFEDCELGPEDRLVTRTFEDALFTAETETLTRRFTSRPHTGTLCLPGTLVNVLTGETPEHSQPPVDETRVFATEIDTDTPQIALPASVEAQVKTASESYTAAVFFHFKATCRVE